MKLSDFVEGELLNTIIAVRFSIIVMFSWQPHPTPLISRFIYSAGLRSKLNGKKKTKTKTKKTATQSSEIVHRSQKERPILFCAGESGNHDIPDLMIYRFIWEMFYLDTVVLSAKAGLHESRDKKKQTNKQTNKQKTKQKNKCIYLWEVPVSVSVFN